MLLATRGAHEIGHPGGTLLAHLLRVHGLLERWGARPALRLAGLCHAFYGTDGLAASLGDAAHRDELATVVGPEAERIVHLYASCDRGFSYPRLTDGTPVFRDRFAGVTLRPTPAQVRDFAELTVANELDIVRADAGARERYGAALRDLFTSWDDLITGPARQAVRTILA
jgi:hypothetical protein